VWATQVKRLKVGTSRRFSTTTADRLLTALQSVLAPQFSVRAREVATQLTKPEASVGAAADLLEEKASVMAAK
jgi:UDP:flavonoid glycosyltransferase YjiC (YdhE family)